MILLELLKMTFSAPVPGVSSGVSVNISVSDFLLIANALAVTGNIFYMKKRADK